jgi:probable rRNA maturation factor
VSLKVSVVNCTARREGLSGLGPWLARAAPARARGELSVAVVPDSTMRRLNKRFRRKDAVTDVLSFPTAASMPDRVTSTAGVCRPTDRVLLKTVSSLGEVVIAQGVAARQARRLGHTLRDEYRILALHGLLHLLGYDHEVDDGQMARAEARMRKRTGLPTGLIARSR